MSLLAPAGLFAALLLPIVVAIHLWRVRHRRYTLSSTLLWSRVLSETPHRRPRRLPTRYLLLALQLLMLALGAVALARPSLAAPSGRRLVVAVDTSLAMGATDVRPSRLAHTRSLVGRLIDSLTFGDSMILVDAGPEPRVLVASSDHAALRHALAGLVQGYGPSSLAQDGPLLSGLAASAGARARVDLFAADGTPRATLSALGRLMPGLRVTTVGTTTADRAVDGLTIACNGKDCQAYARLVNTGARSITTHLTALVDGAGRSYGVTLLPGSSSPIVLGLPTGARTVELRLAGADALAADDTAWAVAPLPVRRRVLLVADDPASQLAQALRAIPNVTLTTTTPDAYNDGMTGNVDLTVLDTSSSSVQPPGNLLIIDPSRDDGWLFDAPGFEQAPSVTAVDEASPLMRGVDLGSLVISSATRAVLPAWAHVDIEGDAGPLLFSGTTGGRRVAALLFDPRPSADVNGSNLATLLAFPTLLQNAVETLAPAGLTSTTAGAAASADVSRQGTVWLRPLVGRPVALPSSGDLTALPPLRPGLYSMTGAAGGGTLRLAANTTAPTDPAEPPPVSMNAPPGLPFPGAGLPAAPLEGWAVAALLALLALGGEWWYYVRHT